MFEILVLILGLISLYVGVISFPCAFLAFLLSDLGRDDNVVSNIFLFLAGAPLLPTFFNFRLF